MVDNNENKHLKVDLSLDRTFLALLRTAGVLTGIAAILIKQKKALVINRIFIIILIILLLWGTFSFSKYIIKSNTFQKGAINNSAYISLSFSGLLILLLIMMLLYSFNLF
jgi:hypothetical protein